MKTIQQDKMQNNINKINFFLFFIFFITLILAQTFIYGPKGNILYGSIFFGIAILLFFITEKKYNIPNIKIDINKKNEIIIFIIIILIAAFLRIYKINELPPDLFADEGDMGYQTCKLINGEEPEGKADLPFFIYAGSSCIQTAATYIYLSAPIIKFWGVGKIQIKIPAIIFGILSVASFYFLVRNMYGVFPAILGGFLIAFMRWHINFSRIAWSNTISIFSVILFLYFGWRAYTKRRLIDFLCFGLAFALAQYGYQSSRIAPLWLIVFFIYLLFFDEYTEDRNDIKKILTKSFGLLLVFILSFLIITILKKYGFWDIFINQSLYYAIGYKKEILPKILFYIMPLFLLVVLIFTYFIATTRFFKENLIKIVLSILIFLLFFMPLGIYIYKYQFAWLARGNATLIWNNIPEQYKYDSKKKLLKTLEMYVNNIKLSFLGLLNKGDENPRWNFPFQPHLEFFTGIFFVVGLLVFIKSFFKLKEFFIISALITLAQATLLNTENPNASRSAILIPIILIIAVIGILKLIDYFVFQFKNINNKYIFLVLIFLGIIIGINNYRQYFVEQVKNPDFQYGFSPEEYNMAMTLKKLGHSWRGIVLLRYELRRTFKYLMYGDNTWLTFAPYANIPVREDDGKNYIYMSVFENLPIVPILKDIYPNGEYEEFRTKYWPHKVPVYFSYKVPNSDIKNALEDFNKNKRGLEGYYYKSINWTGEPVTVTVEPFIFFRHFYSPISLPYSMHYKGKIKIDKSDVYEFKLISTGNTTLFIDGKEMIKLSIDPKKQVETNGVCSIYLKSGFHKLDIKYNSAVWHLGMELRWKKPGDIDFEVVPYRLLYRD